MANVLVGDRGLPATRHNQRLPSCPSVRRWVRADRDALSAQHIGAQRPRSLLDQSSLVSGVEAVILHS